MVESNLSKFGHTTGSPRDPKYPQKGSSVNNLSIKRNVLLMRLFNKYYVNLKDLTKFLSYLIDTLTLPLNHVQEIHGQKVYKFSIKSMMTLLETSQFLSHIKTKHDLTVYFTAKLKAAF